jgi:hypothetical protein
MAWKLRQIGGDAFQALREAGGNDDGQAGVPAFLRSSLIQPHLNLVFASQGHSAYLKSCNNRQSIAFIRPRDTLLDLPPTSVATIA